MDTLDGLPNFKDLQYHAERLVVLLKEKEYGKISWALATSKHWRAIAQLYSDTAGKEIDLESTSKRAIHLHKKPLLRLLWEWLKYG